ncbi:MAG: hypothetical protein JW737_03815 [Acidobacteria bacterium]|nr:hypothetical protein [Acidobacteriota bacterium]
MSKFLFFKKLIEKLTEFPFLRKVFGILAKVIAVGLIVVGIIAIIDHCSYVGETAEQIVAWVLTEVILLFVLFIWFHIWWMKGLKICELKEKDYYFAPVAQHYLRGLGEWGAVFYIFYYAIAGMLQCFILGVPRANLDGLIGSLPEIMHLVPIVPTTGFTGGLFYLLNGFVGGLLHLGIMYLLAELLGIYMDIARGKKS